MEEKMNRLARGLVCYGDDEEEDEEDDDGHEDRRGSKKTDLNEEKHVHQARHPSSFNTSSSSSTSKHSRTHPQDNERDRRRGREGEDRKRDHHHHHHRDSPKDGHRYTENGRDHYRSSRTNQPSNRTNRSQQNVTSRSYDDDRRDRRASAIRRSRSRSPNYSKSSIAERRRSPIERHGKHGRGNEFQDHCTNRIDPCLPLKRIEDTIKAEKVPDLPSSSRKAEGLEMAKYYNKNLVNPVKFAQREEKKRLLWAQSKRELKSEEKAPQEAEDKELAADSASRATSAKLYGNLKFSGTQGDQMTEKFRKLMGIKVNQEQEKKGDATLLKKQEHIFNELDKQYSVARMAAHTHRGIGLGFANN